MVDRLGWTLVHFIWEGTAVALALMAVLLLCRRSSPAIRYGLALGTLAVLAVLPVGTFFSLSPTTTDLALSGAGRFTPGEVVDYRAPIVPQMPFLVGLWCAGVAVLSLRLFGGMAQLARWRKRSTIPATCEDQARLDVLATRLGMRRRIQFLFSDHIEVPSAWGVVRPVVVFPACLMTKLSPAQIEGILLHELAHVRRHDYLVNLLQGVVETALFYHPAVWWVSSVVRREREHLCDDVAVSALGDPMPYARALLLLEERRQAPRPSLSAKEGNLMNRIARILSPKPAPIRLASLAPGLAALSVVALALGGVLRAEAQATKPAAKKPHEKAMPVGRSWHRSGLDLSVHAFPKEPNVLRIVARSGGKNVVGYYRADVAGRERMQNEISLLREKIAAQKAVNHPPKVKRLGGEPRAIAFTKAPMPNEIVTQGHPAKGLKLSNLTETRGELEGRADMQQAQVELSRQVAIVRKNVAIAQEDAVKAQNQALTEAVQRETINRRTELLAEAQIAEVKADQVMASANQTRGTLKLQEGMNRFAIETIVRSGREQSVKDVQKAIAGTRYEIAQNFDPKTRAFSVSGFQNDPFKRSGQNSASSISGLSSKESKSVYGRSFNELGALQSTKTLNGLGSVGKSNRFDITTNLSGFSLFGEPKIELGERGKVSIDAKDLAFGTIVRALARKAKLSVVMERGVYLDVSVILTDRSAADALAILCKAANATLRSEKGVYYVTPKSGRSTLSFGGGTFGPAHGGFGSENRRGFGS